MSRLLCQLSYAAFIDKTNANIKSVFLSTRIHILSPLLYTGYSLNRPLPVYAREGLTFITELFLKCTLLKRYTHDFPKHGVELTLRSVRVINPANTHQYLFGTAFR
ncbi:MAG: hypothetical protein LBO67_08790 [Spirochaetaceae bacterium]|nr:hypothetical protein [Spirochaetaceae bacterium]